MNDYVPSDLVVMRTPLLPMEELEAWRQGLQAPRAGEASLEEALVQDRALLRDRLRALVDRPEIAEALFLASPDLFDSLEEWRRGPESKKGKRTEQGLVRYILRMSSRPTPFGLFSGCTAGRTGAKTHLGLAASGHYRRHSRLDMDYLYALCEHLARDPKVRAELRYRPNSSLYEASGRVRFAESRVRGRLRTYHLVAVDAFDALRDTLQRAADGARLHELAEALVASDPEGEITLDDANAFVHDLVDSQLLLPELAPPVTGEESTAGLLRQLADVPSAGEARVHLLDAERTLARIDAAGAGAAPELYRELARGLEPLGVPVELSRLFQVDLIKPESGLVLGEPELAEILRGVELLHRFARSQYERSLEELRGAFQDRYGTDREVPLLKVLDEESGIGFERSGSAGAEASPLLAGLSLRRRTGAARLNWGSAETALLQVYTRALAEGAMEVVLTDDDVKALENPEPVLLPDAIHVTLTLAAASSEAIARGDYRLFLHSAMGPSGVRMLGRFCHADDAIREGVARHIAAEEALRPDAVFAELVHLPAGRLGNILARPVLRDYEIAFLGTSGAPPERQLPLDDLLVSVSGNRIRLRSKRLDREVIPRLSTAHNTTGESLGVYRFLAALQRGVGMFWSWGPLESAPFLPRVVHGRLVLSRARWVVMARELEPIVSASGAARYRLAQRFREERRMPRYVLLTDGDHELLVDFENTLALDAVLDLVKNRHELTLTELYPAHGELCASGPEGRFVHELVVPFTRRPVPVPVPVSAPSVVRSPKIARTFPPGSEWLYAKLYAGTATADRVLLDELAPLAAEAVASGAADRWFFIRYADPQWHLRVRFHGDPRHLREQVQPALDAMAARLIESGAAWKMQYDTYEREIERYGGPEAIELAEELFFRDSEAVVSLLESCSGDDGSDLRWRLMLTGIDRLFADFGLDLPARLTAAEATRNAYAGQFHFDLLRDPLATRFRADRASLLRILDEPIPALSVRSAATLPIARQLAGLRLALPLRTILTSLAHMFVNRLSRSAGPEHELVLYDYLVQLYRSQLARAAKTADARVVAR